MDLSKTFDTVNHELLIATLHAYGFNKDPQETILSYLLNRYERVKVNTTFSSWAQMIQGVRQGSLLWSVLFNIYLNDLFFLFNGIDICNFSDYSTAYVFDVNLASVLAVT